MIYPELEKYLDRLVLLYLTDSLARKEMDDMGVKFSRLPRCNSTEIGARAQAFSDSKLMKHELNTDIALLERFVDDFTTVPVDGATMVAKLDKLLSDHVVCEIGKVAQESPELGRKLIQDYKNEVYQDVVWGEFGDLAGVYLPVWEERVKQKREMVKVPRFEMLSEAIGGFNPGRLALLMGATGFGKTNFGLTLALRARGAMGVAYANMEMSYEDIVKRMAVLDAEIPHAEFYRKVLVSEWRAQFKQTKHGLFITNGRNMTPRQLKGWVRNMKRNEGIEMAIVDYDQCLTLQTDRDTPEWKAMQNTLMDFDEFSKEEEIFLCVISQVNRDGEIAASHRATYKAHTILNFYRDEIYGPIIHAQKNRHGKKDAAIRVSYDDETSKITEQELMYLNKKTKPQKRETPRVRNYAPGMED